MAIATLKKTNSSVNGRRPVAKSRKAAQVKRGWNYGEFKRAFVDEIKSRNEVHYQSVYQHHIGRRMQVVIKVAAILGMIFTIMNLTLEYNESPTLTTMESDSYPARNVDFPGIAICSTNRMSLLAVNEFAEELYSFETTKIFNVSYNEIRDMLKHLGHLYVFDVDESDIEDAQFLHAILTRAYGDYNIDSLMMQLTPKCRSILKFCSWEGKDRVCDNMFFLRKTQDGYCCTFNYARRSDGFGSTKRSGFVSSMVERSTLINPEYGLSVVLNSRVDDYYYKSIPSNGFKALIYSSQDYPDAPSGSLKEIMVPQKSEVFVSMDATSLYSVPEVVEYDVSARNCLFNTEQNKIFQGYYSYSDCIMYCRIQDILRLCKCIPFFYPRLDDFDKYSPKSCNLDDLPCLKEFKNKWRQISPRLSKQSDFDDSDIIENPSTYLHCDCFPSCDDVAYKISSSRIPLTTDKILWDRNMILNRNYSLLHIYFDGPNTIRLKQDVLFYWYELMSDYGGICSLFLGMSIIDVIEIIYVSLNLIFNRKRVLVINRAEEQRDRVETPMQDASDAAAAATAKRRLDNGAKTLPRVMQDEARRLNTVKVIDIDETPALQQQQQRRISAQTVQLYWQEFVKPINKPTMNN